MVKNAIKIKEDIIMEFSKPIYDKYLDEDYELCKQEVEEDDDEVFFVQIQVVDLTKENYSKVRFIVVAIEQ